MQVRTQRGLKGGHFLILFSFFFFLLSRAMNKSILHEYADLIIFKMNSRRGFQVSEKVLYTWLHFDLEKVLLGIKMVKNPGYGKKASNCKFSKTTLAKITVKDRPFNIILF